MSHGLVSQAFQDACAASHLVEFTANIYRWQAGANTLLEAAVPITGGQLQLTTTDPTRRRLTLDVAAPTSGEPTSWSHPYAPFGQYVVLWVHVRLLGADTRETLKLGEYPIITTSHDWPSGRTRLECEDWSSRVDEHKTIRPRPDGITPAAKIDQAVKWLVDAALPDRVYEIINDADSTQKAVEDTVSNLGEGRWTYALRLCDRAGLEAFFDSAGRLVIRRSPNDDEPAPGVGPDIGDPTRPVAWLKMGEHANITALHTSVSRQGGANKAWLVQEALDEPSKIPNAVKAEWKTYVTSKEPQPGSPIAYGDAFGRIDLVESRRIRKPSSAAHMADADKRVKDLYARRKGLIRRLEIDSTPLWWLEPDDRIKVTWPSDPLDPATNKDEAHYVETVTFSLAPGEAGMRLTTRSVSVADPGFRWAL